MHNYHVPRPCITVVARSFLQKFVRAATKQILPYSKCSLQQFLHVRRPISEVRPWTHQSTARQAALSGRPTAGAVQAVFHGPPMSVAQGTTVYDGLLHTHLRQCSSPAPVVRRQSPAVCTTTPVFDVRSSGLFCGRPGGLELVTRLSSGSDTFF